MSVKNISDNIIFQKTFQDNETRVLLMYECKEDEKSNVVFNKRITLKPVYKINFDTKEILDTYDGLIGAANKLSISTTTVAKYINSKKTFKIDGIKIALSYDKHVDEEYIVSKELPKVLKKRKTKKIYKICCNTNKVLDIFDGIVDASLKMNIGNSTICRHIKSEKELNFKNNNNEIISVFLKHTFE